MNSAPWHDALGDKNDAVVVPGGEAVIEHADDAVHVHPELGDDGDLRAGGDGRHEREVPAPAAHDLDHEAAAVRGSGGADHVDEADDGVERGIDADAHIGAEDVVVDRAGQADDGQAELVQGARAAERTVAADDDEAVDFALGEDFEGAHLAGLGGEFGAAAGLEKGAGVAHAPGDDVVVEVEEFVVEQALGSRCGCR